MRIAISGAGAMGGLFGARLAAAGNPVVLIDVDAAVIQAIRERGLRLDDDAGRAQHAIAACRAEEATGPVDLLIVFTKGMHTRDAVIGARHLLHPDSSVMTIQNGLGNDRVIADVVGDDHVLIGVTTWPADVVAPGHVRSHGAGVTRLWSMDGKRSEALVATARVLDEAGLACILDEKVRAAIWEKVIFNAALNGLAAVTGLTVGGIADSPAGRALVDQILAEGIAVAAACNVAIDAQAVRRTVGAALSDHREHKPSMLQDIEAGRRTEVETILGALLRSGAEVGAHMPTIATLTDLVRIIEGAGR